MDYASNPAGGFNDVTKAFKDDPTLEHYHRLRRADPNAEIEVAVLNGLDAVFAMEEEFKRYGIDAALVASCLDADPAAISELSLRLIENRIEAQKLEEEGETQLVSRGLVIPEKMVDWLICLMLEAMSWNDDLTMHRDLIVLLRDRLGGTNPHYKQSVDAHERRQNAKWLAASLKAQGVKVTIRMVAGALGVAPSTVLRWFPHSSFEDEVERLSRVFDKDGKLIPLGVTLRGKEVAQQPGTEETSGEA